MPSSGPESYINLLSCNLVVSYTRMQSLFPWPTDAGHGHVVSFSQQNGDDGKRTTVLSQGLTGIEYSVGLTWNSVIHPEKPCPGWLLVPEDDNSGSKPGPQLKPAPRLAQESLVSFNGVQPNHNQPGDSWVKHEYLGYRLFVLVWFWPCSIIAATPDW